MLVEIGVGDRAAGTLEHVRLVALPADALSSEPVRDAVVIGGGIAGLAAAWDLRNRDVVVLEATERVGGRIRSERARCRTGSTSAPTSSAGPGSATGRLVADVGVESVPVPGHLVALELNGKLLVGGRPELYPLRLPLPPRGAPRARARGRAAAARRGPLRARGQAAPRRVARPRRAGACWRTATTADVRRVARTLPGDADLMFRATVTRSTAEPEEITAGAGTGYFALVWSSGGGLSRNIVGGAGTLIDGIAAELGRTVVTGADVAGDRAGRASLVRVRYR